jgi:hypothetical protein
MAPRPVRSGPVTGGGVAVHQVFLHRPAQDPAQHLLAARRVEADSPRDSIESSGTSVPGLSTVKKRGGTEQSPPAGHGTQGH